VTAVDITLRRIISIEDSQVTHFYPEDGGSRFHQNFGNNQKTYMVSVSRVHKKDFTSMKVNPLA